MAKERGSLAFRHGMVLALVLIVLAATMWAALPRMIRTTAPIPGDAIYRVQHLNLF